MTALDSYSPLESLLLFQALAAFGTHADAFIKVSESLRNCAPLQKSSHGDDNRFEPDSLKDLYVSLLKEDAKQELQRKLEAEDGLTNGDGSANPRKRKIGSPNLRTVEDASQHAHLLPYTVARLYANYQEYIINEIKADERRFDDLTRETRASGQQESQASIEAATVSYISREDSTPAHEVSTLQKDSTTSHESEEDASIAKTKIDDIINHHVPTSQDLAQNSSIEPGSAQIHPADNNKHKSYQKDKQQPPFAAHPTSPTTTQPSLPHLGTLDPSQAPQLSPNVSSSAVQHVTASTLSEPARRFHSPQSNAPHRLVPEAPVPSVPVGQNGPNQDISATQSVIGSTPPTYAPHYRSNVPPGEQERAQHYVFNQGHPSHANQASYQQQYPHPHSQSQPPIVPLPPPKGGVLLQPFQVTPQAPSPSHQFPRPAPATTPGQKPHSKQSTSFSQGQESLPNHGYHPPAIGHAVPRTPSTVPGKRIAKRSDTTNSPGSATAWKISIPATTGRRPLPEEISPVDEDEPLFHNDATNSLSQESTKLGGALAKRRGRSRSSATDDMTATVSIPGGRRVKHEPTTPMSTADQDLYQSTPRPTRNSSFKRKQEDGELYEDEGSPPGSPRRDPHTVIAYKNFDKMTQHLMENITSHKLASIFANPVKDRDAEGYSEVIRRPQDLKSIKSAIRAGSKAVAQASVDVLQSSPGPGGGGVAGTVTLPFSEDFVPPKGIVNPAQLESELMRMFANAVMFNPGGDEVVQDTREMFDDVEQIISSWRSTEKGSERQDSVEAVEDGGASVKKRRA